VTTDYATPGSALTPRETEALILTGKGLPDHEIARLMEISRHTVRQYLKNIFVRLDVNSRVEAAVWAAKAGML
jgi:DNA-binding CsgD family transcriptional regulator